MKELLKTPFAKFIMVLVSIMALAGTVWVVYEVIEEIRYPDSYDSYYDSSARETRRTTPVSPTSISVNELPESLARVAAEDQGLVEIERIQFPDGSYGYEFYYADGSDRYFRADDLEIYFD